MSRLCAMSKDTSDNTRSLETIYWTMVLLSILSFDPNENSDERRNQDAQKLQRLASDLGRAAPNMSV